MCIIWSLLCWGRNGKTDVFVRQNDKGSIAARLKTKTEPMSLPDEFIDDLDELPNFFFGENGGKRPLVFYDDAFRLPRIFIPFGCQFYASDASVLGVVFLEISFISKLLMQRQG